MRRTIVIVALSLCCCIVLSFLDQWFWPSYLLCQFRIQYACAIILTIGACAACKKNLAAGICFLAMLLNAIPLVPQLANLKSANNSPDKRLRVLEINVDYKNDQYSRVVDEMIQSGADIVVIEELTPEWKEKLSQPALMRLYPYKRFEPRTDTFGIGIFSRVAFNAEQTLLPAGYQWPALSCEINFNDKPLQIVAVHFMGPMTYAGWLQQVAQMDDMASDRALSKHPDAKSLVIVGDFNATPWTAIFRHLENGLKLHDSRLGFGLQASWPSEEPIIVLRNFGIVFAPHLFGANALVALPLDHCLISQDLAANQRVIGKFIGSDHYPVTIDIVRAK